jgi:rubrerythrin
MGLKGSKTEKNLLIAFAGESQARNRYTYYAGEAKKAGYEYIAAIFLETAENEKEHAKVFFKHLGEGTAEIVAGYPFHLGDTLSNLMAAVEGENFEWTTLYQNFAIEADQEGFKEIAASFREIAKVEHFHASRYQALVEHVKQGTLFKRDETVTLALPQLRLHRQGQGGPGSLPILQASPGLL